MSRMTGTTRRARQAQPMPSCSPRALARRLAALPDSFTSHPAVAQLIDQLAHDHRARRYWRAELRKSDGGYIGDTCRVLDTVYRQWRAGSSVPWCREFDAVFSLTLYLSDLHDRMCSQFSYWRVWRRKNLNRVHRGVPPAEVGTGARTNATDWWDSLPLIRAGMKYAGLGIFESDLVARTLAAGTESIPVRSGLPCNEFRGRRIAWQAKVRLTGDRARWCACLARDLLVSLPACLTAPTVSPVPLATSCCTRLSTDDMWPPPWRPVIEALTCAVLTAAPPARVPVPVGEGQCARLTVAA